MVLTKRVVAAEEPVPLQPSGNILLKTNHQSTALLLEEMQQLFSFAADIFAGLTHVASQTGTRVRNLGLRVDNCLKYIPQAEAYLQGQGTSLHFYKFADMHESYRFLIVHKRGRLLHV